MKKLLFLATIPILSILTHTAVSHTVTIDYNNTYYTSPYATEKEKGLDPRFFININIDGKTISLAGKNYVPIEEILPKNFSVNKDIEITILRQAKKTFRINKDTRITIAFGPGKKINFYTGTVNLHVLLPAKLKKNGPYNYEIKQNNKEIKYSISSTNEFAKHYGFIKIKPGPVEMIIKNNTDKSGAKIFNVTKGGYGIYVHAITDKKAVVSRYFPDETCKKKSQHDTIICDTDWMKPISWRLLLQKKHTIPLK